MDICSPLKLLDTQAWGKNEWGIFEGLGWCTVREKEWKITMKKEENRKAEMGKTGREPERAGGMQRQPYDESGGYYLSLDYHG